MGFTAQPSTRHFTLERLSKIPLKALVAFTARCVRRVQPLWGELDARERAQLERAVEITEGVGAGRYTHLDARRADGVDVQRWSPQRPDYCVTRTAPGAAIYALVCACCEKSEEASTPALLTVREAHFAAAGDARNLSEAEARFRAADQAPVGSALSLVATGIRRDFEAVAAITAGRTDDPAVSKEFFGPLWLAGIPDGWTDFRE